MNEKVQEEEAACKNTKLQIIYCLWKNYKTVLFLAPAKNVPHG